MNIKLEVEPYLEFCRYRKELDAKTLKAYRIDLRQFFEFVLDNNPDKQKIESYITNLHKEYKKKTVKRKIASIKAFFCYLETEEIVTEVNPFHKIKVKFKETFTLPKTIPRKDIEKLLNYMYQLEYQSTVKQKFLLRDISIIETFFATGMRVYELSNLKTEDIDLNTGVVKIMGKGSKERNVYIVNKDVRKLLSSYYKTNKEAIDSNAYFFINSRGDRYTEQSIRKMIKKYTESANITLHITPHMFRHSVATYLLEEGVDVCYIREILGHSSIKTTQIYIHVASGKQIEILRNLHPRNKMNILIV